MSPVVLELMRRSAITVETAVTGQHREMLDQVLGVFQIKPDYDLNVMQPNQDLFEVTSRILIGMKNVLEVSEPDLVLVHGDTTTSTATAIAAFYKQIPVGHVEAGLRTYNLTSPFPEEGNRQLTSKLAAWHYAPTIANQKNLVAEGIDVDHIVITGNSVIDALFWVTQAIESSTKRRQELTQGLHEAGLAPGILETKFTLITGHRRENFGQGFVNICSAISELSERYPDVNFVYPVHLNPKVSTVVEKLLSGKDNIHLIKPLSYEPFVWLLKKCRFVMTDSGGVQEEAPSLGKPVLVMRETTERPEAVAAGTVELVGTSPKKIFLSAEQLILDSEKYSVMSQAHNPYGDGNAAKKIADHVMKLF